MCDWIEREMMQKPMFPTKQSIRHPVGPVIARPKNSGETRMFTMLHDVREALVTLSSRAGWLK